MKESEETTMKHKATITTKEEKTVEEYWVMESTREVGVTTLKTIDVIDTKELDHEPSISEIAQFLLERKGIFVTVSHNYRFASELPF